MLKHTKQQIKDMQAGAFVEDALSEQDAVASGDDLVRAPPLRHPQ